MIVYIVWQQYPDSEPLIIKILKSKERADELAKDSKYRWVDEEEVY